MSKKVVLVVLGVLLLSLPACRATVSKEDYDKLDSELSLVKLELQTLQQQIDLNIIETNEAGVYAAFIDISLYPYYATNGITSRFSFESREAWFQKLKEGTRLINDPQLIDYVDKINPDDTSTLLPALLPPIEYALGRILEKTIQ